MVNSWAIQMDWVEHMVKYHNNRIINMDNSLEVDSDLQACKIHSSYCQILKARVILQSQTKFYQGIKIITIIILDLR